MNYQAWYNGAYGDVGFSARGEPDDENVTVECASCGADLPASWDRDSEEYVADEACECELEPIDDPTPLSPITTLCADLARDLTQRKT